MMITAGSSSNIEENDYGKLELLDDNILIISTTLGHTSNQNTELNNILKNDDCRFVTKEELREFTRPNFCSSTYN